MRLKLMLSAAALCFSAACSEPEPESVIGDALEDAVDRAREVEETVREEAEELRDAIDEATE